MFLTVGNFCIHILALCLSLSLSFSGSAMLSSLDTNAIYTIAVTQHSFSHIIRAGARITFMWLFSLPQSGVGDGTHSLEHMLSLTRIPRFRNFWNVSQDVVVFRRSLLFFKAESRCHVLLWAWSASGQPQQKFICRCYFALYLNIRSVHYII